ncbi:MAG: anthranilate phosphoribosyltransferase [Desulfovibrionales bacterium]
MNMGRILEGLAAGKDLSQVDAEQVFDSLFAGELSQAQSGAFLMGLRIKGETPVEISAAVKSALKQARLIPDLSGKLIDTCGTGGDNKCSFNCSTATSLVLAGMGYQVVKHGNRAMSSKCGSADVVEDLGLSIMLDPGDVVQELANRKFVFLFAPNYHPAFRHVMPVRKELGCRTLFNLMGPLLNPARPTHQLLGVPNPSIMPLIAEALLLTGVSRAAVIHGAGGYDEITPFGPAELIWIKDGKFIPDTLQPESLGIPTHAPEDVTVAGREEAVRIVLDLLSGSGPQAMRDMLLLNVAVALHLLEEDLPLKKAVEMGRDALDRKVGRKVLHA